MFIGGPIVNKAVRRLCKFPNDSNTFSHCRSSVEFDLDFNSTDNEIDTNRGKIFFFLIFIKNNLYYFFYFI